MRAWSGGVAERLIAPVLKTGRPKGLVSSNLTPSATSIADCRLRIANFSKKQAIDKNCAKDSENRRKHDIGQIMRGNVHARETDEHRDWQTSETDPPVCEQ